ncbi:SWIM zinc finger family protein [Streptomyces sp. NPDC002742]|uniref:SWIM zinc finger family protein n=1 Tax=Streptomyces sp. NPDC002742 TaxID=3364663 RepID=UPI003684115E
MAIGPLAPCSQRSRSLEKRCKIGAGPFPLCCLGRPQPAGVCAWLSAFASPRPATCSCGAGLPCRHATQGPSLGFGRRSALWSGVCRGLE